jgi:hypothetical protein
MQDIPAQQGLTDIQQNVPLVALKCFLGHIIGTGIHQEEGVLWVLKDQTFIPMHHLHAQHKSRLQ